MAGIRARAIVAFKEYGQSMESMATAEFKQDLGVGPDEVAYLGDHQFLFKIEDLHIRGYIEYMGSRLYAKGYRLAAPCPHCDGLIVAKEHFYDLAGLGAALDGLPRMHIMCDGCARTHTD